MTKPNAARSHLQSILLDLYRRSRNSKLMQTSVGRRAFENAYLAYKVLLEAGPIGRLRPFVAPGTWAIDVGANIGLFTLKFARWVQNDGRVIAIEPETTNYMSLRRRLSHFDLEDRVSIYQAVAAEQTGTLQLEINPDHPGDHKIAATGVPVAAVTLDGILSRHNNPKVSLIKIDVQGAELRVLQGASTTLARCHPALFIETDDLALRRQGTNVAGVFDHLAGLGYRPHRLCRFGSAQPFDSKELSQNSYQDVLFLHAAAREFAGVTAP